LGTEACVAFSWRTESENEGITMSTKNRRRVWVPNVAVSVRALETRLDVAAAQGLGPDQTAAARGIRALLGKAEAAAFGEDPRARRGREWWSGALVEVAYQNLHAAKAQMVDVYDEAEIAAEVPSVVARAQQTLHRDDPRRLGAIRLTEGSLMHQRAFLRRAIEDSYDALDRQHERVRSFRNIVLILAGLITVLVGATVAAVRANPKILPLCFPSDGNGASATSLLNCPTGGGVTASTSGDIFVIGLLGLLGGALAAAVSIRNLRGTSTPYDVPVALALLKVPLGAFTAILGLVAIQGKFVPGLTALDSQQQILAYALLLGFGQQVFTRSLDVRAQTLLNGLPSKDVATQPAGEPGAAIPVPPVAPTGTATLPAQRPGGGDGGDPPGGTSAKEPPEGLTFQPSPDDTEAPQDDGSDPMPNAVPGDHR
jgi:hypothetical protein